MSSRVLAGLGLVLVLGVREASAQALPPQELHDRIVAVFHRNAHRPVVAGDTFVTWSPRPVLYATVRRTADSVTSSLVRADGLVGTAESRWVAGRQTSGRVIWDTSDSVRLSLRFTAGAQLIIDRGTRIDTLSPPAPVWAVADYGMDDQLLPLLACARDRPVPVRFAVYRPVAGKWDLVTAELRPFDGGCEVQLRETDAETWTWLVSAEGKLLMMVRSKYPDFERRPLELTPAAAEYLRLRARAPAAR